jgi:hypothetical protein
MGWPAMLAVLRGLAIGRSNKLMKFASGQRARRVRSSIGFRSMEHEAHAAPYHLISIYKHFAAAAERFDSFAACPGDTSFFKRDKP